jgi:hypothetical protein
MASPDLDKLDVSDTDTDDLFTSPSRVATKAPKTPSKSSENQRNAESRYDAEQVRDAALQKELEGVRNINEVIEGVISSLETAKGNMAVSVD